MYIVLFSLSFTINIGIITYFVYYKYINCNKKNISKYGSTYQTTIYIKEVKKINIKSAYHYFEDMVNIKVFYSNLLEINKKSHKDINIYYIGYIMIKKFSDCENIYSLNPLYLTINSATGYFKERNGEKYLILDSTEKYEEIFQELYQKLKHLKNEKNYFVKKIMQELELIQAMIYH